MKALLRVIIHTTYMHVVTSQRAIDCPVSTERQIRAVHEWFFANAMSEADTMAVPANGNWIGDQLPLCRWENEPAPKFFYRSNMAKRTITVISMRGLGMLFRDT